jgi:hypothetical protein
MGETGAKEARLRKTNIACFLLYVDLDLRKNNNTTKDMKAEGGLFGKQREPEGGGVDKRG